MARAGLNQDDSRVHNRTIVLKLIKQHPGITRADLAVQTGLSKPAITKIVNVYLDKGIIQDDKEGSSRNKGLSFAEGVFYGIVIYLGRLSITGALYDMCGKVILREELPKGVAFYGNDNLTHDTRNLIEKIIAGSPVGKEKILAIGIAAPGAVSSSKGAIFNRSLSSLDNRGDIPFNWGKIHLVEYLVESIGLPVFLENNSSLCALAESWFGKGLGVQDFVQYSIGIGLGAGAVLKGELFSGNDGTAVEIGHTTVNLEGDLCFCGNRGCLETVAGFANIVREYDGEVNLPDDAGLTDRLIAIFSKARENESRAVEVIRNHSQKIAIGAVTLINMFSPEKLIISTNELDGIPVRIMLRDIENYIRKHAYPVIAETVEIEVSELGEDIHLHGAYALILEKLYALITEKIEGGI